MRGKNMTNLINSFSSSSCDVERGIPSTISCYNNQKNRSIILPKSSTSDSFFKTSNKPNPNTITASKELRLNSSNSNNHFPTTVHRTPNHNWISTIRTTNKKGHIPTTVLKSSNYSEQEYTISIIENYAREVGISAINNRTMEFNITQFIDNEAYINTLSMINYWRPIEIVMNAKSENSCWHWILKSIFKNSFIGFLPRKFFNEDQGKDIYTKSISTELSNEEINMKYVCMASWSGWVNYLDSNPNYVQPEVAYINYHYWENHLNISFNSTIDLELLLNKVYNKSISSLYSLFKCKTISGSRLLRNNILQPYAIKQDIDKRWDAVQELMSQQEVFWFLSNNLKYFKELETNISKLLHKTAEPTENILKQILTSIEGIRFCLTILPGLLEGIDSLQSQIFLTIKSFLKEKTFSDLLNNIETVVEDFDFSNSNMKITRKQDTIFFLVKEGTNSWLDVSRQTYSDTITEIYNEFDSLKALTNDPNIKLCYADNKGYYIIIGENYFDKNNFSWFKKIGKKMMCSNITLNSLSERIREIKSDLLTWSIDNWEGVITILRKKINYLYVLSSHIANLDVICAFTEYANSGIKISRPRFYNNTASMNFIYGKNCRHPLLEKFILECCNDNNFIVPNDYFFIENFNLLLLKGTNASGKTTYMKQWGLLIILAQIGSFVPCDYFIFTLRNFLYTRFDSNDSIEENKGLFIKQIIEIQKVITNHSDHSLILLDEPFDNTNTSDVLAISLAILDLFNWNFKNSFIVISSHNSMITNLSRYYFNALIGTMEVVFMEKEIQFLFKFKYNTLLEKEDNWSEIGERDYGIKLAEMIEFNESIINYSKEISRNLGEQKGLDKHVKCSWELNYLKMFVFRLFMNLFEIMAAKELFVLEDEVTIKINDLLDYINNAFN